MEMMPFANTPTMEDPAETMLLESLKEKNEDLQGQIDHVKKKYREKLKTIREDHADLEEEHGALAEKHNALEEEHGALAEKHNALVKKYNTLVNKHNTLVQRYKSTKKVLDDNELVANNSNGNGKRARVEVDSPDEEDDDEEEMDEDDIEAERKKQFEAYLANNKVKLDDLITSIINDIQLKLNQGADIDGRVPKDGWQQLLSMWFYDNFDMCKDTVITKDVNTSTMFFVRHYETRKRSKSPKKKGGRWVWKVLQSYRSFKRDGAPPVAMTLGLADCFE
jgi:hypothetical protein